MEAFFSSGMLSTGPSSPSCVEPGMRGAVREAVSNEAFDIFEDEEEDDEDDEDEEEDA